MAGATGTIRIDNSGTERHGYLTADGEGIEAATTPMHQRKSIGSRGIWTVEDLFIRDVLQLVLNNMACFETNVDQSNTHLWREVGVDQVR